MNREAITTYFNYSQIAGENLEATDLDPFNELGLNEEQRERMNSRARRRIISIADQYLDTYGATMVGNGDVYGPLQYASMVDREELKEVLGVIEFDDIIKSFLKS